MKKKILFLLSDTGGGHRASAMAIGEAIEHLYPGKFALIINDLWKNHMPWPICCFPDMYGWMTGPGKPVWHTLWKLSSYERVQSYLFNTLSPIIQQSVVDYVEELQPDIAISVHPLMNHLGIQWMKHAGLDIPFLTVVTDMVSLHRSWICPAVDHCFVPTQEARVKAVDFGMPSEKLTVHGQPVGLKFRDIPKDASLLKRKLGLMPEKPAILLVAGGEGQIQLFSTARRVARTITQGQLLIVAGRNERLRKKLENFDWNIPVKIFGFVENMPELMGAADILITKAGPGTISEAFIAGLPILISDYIPGQETGNIDYIKKYHAGEYASNNKRLVTILQEWLNSSDSSLTTVARNGISLARPDAALHIARDICARV